MSDWGAAPRRPALADVAVRVCPHGHLPTEQQPITLRVTPRPRAMVGLAAGSSIPPACLHTAPHHTTHHGVCAGCIVRADKLANSRELPACVLMPPPHYAMLTLHWLLLRRGDATANVMPAPRPPGSRQHKNSTFNQRMPFPRFFWLPNACDCSKEVHVRRTKRNRGDRHCPGAKRSAPLGPARRRRCKVEMASGAFDCASAGGGDLLGRVACLRRAVQV